MELAAYENVLYQLYTDDELSALVKDLNEGRDLAVTRNQIRRKLRGVFWLQDYITSLMVITQSGETVFYDRLSFSGQTNVALEALGLSPNLLFDGLSAQNGTTYLPTRYVTFFNGQQYHQFYMGHRILSDRINRTDAVILMGIDDTLLERTLAENWLGEGREKYMFITDSRGRLVWYPEASRIGENLYDTSRSLTDFVAKNSLLDSRELAVYHRISEPSGWQVTSVLDCTSFTRAIDQRLVATVLVTMLSFFAAAVLVWAITGRLMQSVEQVCATMRTVSRGNLSVRLPEADPPKDEMDRLRSTINRMAEGLAETEKMKNEFISLVSHELRTPLTSIAGWADTLSTLDDPASEDYQKGLTIIRRETERLYSMVEELLDFSRMQSGGVRMECRPLDLVAELTDAVLFCEPRIQQEGLVLDYDEPEEMIPVYADPDRLRQVFINVLDNAVKYSAPGGKITVKIWCGEYKAFIEIIDQGRGIPAEDLANVKTRFFKGRNAVRGSGIGLALVDSIMQALDGTLDLRSTLGRGTVVTLGLPVYRR